MLKLTRNTMGSMNINNIEDFDDDTIIKTPITWSYISAIHDLQTENGLHYGNKITKRHVDFKRNKLKKLILFANE